MISQDVSLDLNNHGYLCHVMNYHQFMAAADKIGDESCYSKKELMQLAFDELVQSIAYIPKHKTDLIGAVIFNLVTIQTKIDQSDKAQSLLEEWKDELNEDWVAMCQQVIDNLN